MSQNNDELSTRFEVAFNQIHYKLNGLVQSKNKNFLHVLNIAKDKYSYVKPHYDLLRQYAKLRNSLVHYKLDPVKYIAEPHLDVVEDIEEIQKNICKPPLALSIASKDVLTFNTATQLEEILKKVEETGYSQFPIFNSTGFKGLLTEGGIAKWLSQNIQSGLAMIEGVTASDILAIEKDHNVQFVKRTTNISELEELFESYFDMNKRLEAVIVTETGSSNEKPLGIITTWNLVQIDRTSLSLVAN